MCLNARQMEPYPSIPSLAHPPPDANLLAVVGREGSRSVDAKRLASASQSDLDPHSSSGLEISTN